MQQTIITTRLKTFSNKRPHSLSTPKMKHFIEILEHPRIKRIQHIKDELYANGYYNNAMTSNYVF